MAPPAVAGLGVDQDRVDRVRIDLPLPPVAAPPPRTVGRCQPLQHQPPDAPPPRPPAPHAPAPPPAPPAQPRPSTLSPSTPRPRASSRARATSAQSIASIRGEG